MLFFYVSCGFLGIYGWEFFVVWWELSFCRGDVRVFMLVFCMRWCEFGLWEGGFVFVNFREGILFYNLVLRLEGFWFVFWNFLVSIFVRGGWRCGKGYLELDVGGYFLLSLEFGFCVVFSRRYFRSF